MTNNFWQSFVLTFVPLFIAIDALGNLPFIIIMSEGMAPSERTSMVHRAIATAIIVGLLFLFFGQLILSLMGISVASFAIAGGIILLVLSIRYMTSGQMVELSEGEAIAIVPIGTPLVVGPATITTLLLLATQHPIYIVLVSFMLNLLIAWGLFLLSYQISRYLGQGGLKAISRIFDLLLAAIAVTMILRGLELLGLVQSIGFPG